MTLEIHHHGGGEDGDGPSLPPQPVFYFDVVSAEAYLVAERVMRDLPEVPEWVPVRAADLPARGEAELDRETIERLARERDLQAFRWPAAYPAADTDFAMRVAAYAKGGGRTVQFALAAFRQAFAGGRDLADPEMVLIAAAACEMHPRAILKSAETRAVRTALDASTADALAHGVRDVPAIRVEDRVFHGDAGVEEAAAALRERAALLPPERRPA